MIQPAKLARPALAKSPLDWAVLPNQFATARGSAAQARWLTRIEWTLDNAGNRTAENVKDAGGSLRRTLTQQFNALGRLSQTANAAGQATLFTHDASGNLGNPPTFA